MFQSHHTIRVYKVDVVHFLLIIERFTVVVRIKITEVICWVSIGLLAELQGFTRP